jgi:hypothetical protein
MALAPINCCCVRATDNGIPNARRPCSVTVAQSLCMVLRAQGGPPDRASLQPCAAPLLISLRFNSAVGPRYANTIGFDRDVLTCDVAGLVKALPDGAELPIVKVNVAEQVSVAGGRPENICSI